MAIPPEIRDFETYIVAYSGGKDSTATLLWALDNLPRERVRAVFCDTGAEWPETYDYLDYIERELGIEIERIKAGDRKLPPKRDGTPPPIESTATSLWHLCQLRGDWPKHRARSCTTYLKWWPCRLLSYELDHPVILEGVRAEESKSRQQAGPGLHHNGATPVWRPVFYYTEKEIWDFLRAHHILPNPVYNHAPRVGCWCCIMGRPREVLNFCRLHPDIAQVAADLEQEIDHTWQERHSITNLLRQAQAQIPLFEPQPRFAVVAE